MFLISDQKRSDPEKSLDGFLVDLGADNDDLSGDIRSARADISFTGNIVEMDPLAVFACNDTLRTEDHAVLRVFIKRFESSLYLILRETL